jgi:hypothetical protein
MSSDIAWAVACCSTFFAGWVMHMVFVDIKPRLMLSWEMTKLNYRKPTFGRPPPPAPMKLQTFGQEYNQQTTLKRFKKERDKELN